MSKTDKNTKHNPYQDYLDKKHAGFETPEGLISKIVDKATGSKFAEKKRIIAGEVNEVYEITLQNEKNIIVRISRNDSSSFEAEEKAIRMAAQVGVPAPKVLLIESIEFEGEKLTFCVEEKIEGEPFSNIKNSLGKGTVRSLMSQVGNILSKIHSIHVSGFGGLDRQVPYEKWSEYVFKPFHKKERIIGIARGLNIKTTLVNKAIDALKENESLLNQVTPRLLHGDFSLEHFMVKDEKVSGIIDFENAKGGDPVFDLAWFDYFNGNNILLKWIKNGYSDQIIFKEGFDTKMMLYKLHLGLNLMDYYESEQNSSGLEHAKRKFIENTSLL